MAQLEGVIFRLTLKEIIPWAEGRNLFFLIFEKFHSTFNVFLIYL